MDNRFIIQILPIKSFDFVCRVDCVVDHFLVKLIAEGVKVLFGVEVMQKTDLIVILHEFSDVGLHFLVLENVVFHLRNEVPLFPPMRSNCH